MFILSSCVRGTLEIENQNSGYLILDMTWYTASITRGINLRILLNGAKQTAFTRN